jgi:hypothetical protein
MSQRFPRIRFTTLFAILTADPSSPVRCKTALAVADHARFFFGVFAFLLCRFGPSDGVQGTLLLSNPRELALHGRAHLRFDGLSAGAS